MAPPGRPNHVFDFEDGTSLVDYFPPDNGETGANGYQSAQVHYGYDKFTRPSKTTLADGSTITSNYYRYFFKPSQVEVHAGSGSSSAAGTYYVTYDTNRTQLKSVMGPVNGVE